MASWYDTKTDKDNLAQNGWGQIFMLRWQITATLNINNLRVEKLITCELEPDGQYDPTYEYIYYVLIFDVLFIFDKYIVTHGSM